MSVEVSYPQPHDNIHIPDERLLPIIRYFRQNLEHALNLESEIDGFGLRHLEPITPQSDEPDDIYQRTEGLSGAVIRFASLYSRLIALDVDAAYEEFRTWPRYDSTIFGMLRIWASRNQLLMDAAEAGEVICGLCDEAFWSSTHQRDLLLTLAERWQKWSDEARQKIVERILTGPPRMDGESDEEFDERNAWKALTRITWLKDKGCKLD